MLVLGGANCRGRGTSRGSTLHDGSPGSCGRCSDVGRGNGCGVPAGSHCWSISATAGPSSMRSSAVRA
eukprot:3395546-Pleurochrysis_carterae.AAC.1